MSRRQLLTIIAINAAISLVIAIAVVLIAFNLGVQQAFGPPTPYVIIPATATPRPPSTPSPPPSPSPTIATEEYVVQPGDTLLGIALRLDLDPQLLLDINNLPNADRLLVGQRLRVPLGSVPTPTITPTDLPATPTPTPPPATPTPPRPAATSTLTVTAALTATLATTATQPAIVAVLTPGELATEAVRIANLGQEPLSLRNWSLSEAGGRRYVFPSVILAPGRELLIHTSLGADGPTDLYWGLAEPVWRIGAVVRLSDQSGAVVSTYAIGE